MWRLSWNVLCFGLAGQCVPVVFAAPPLFDYEMAQLTTNTISDLSTKYSNGHLFAFDEYLRNASLPASGSCKTFPGDILWPASLVWEEFGLALGKDASNNVLIPTIPIAAPCYENWGVYDTEKCAQIVENFTSPYIHENDPTSVMYPIYQGKTCLPSLNTSRSSDCTLGGSPAFVVNVSRVEQIQLAVNFARTTNIRLVIKNTGHDYLGKSTAAGSLSIWTHHLKDIAFLPDYAGPGYAGKAMKIGAGVTVREVYEKAQEYGVSALGGICPTVGYAGGYIAGGGHTPLSGLYGMAADHVMALQVVTADGRFVTACSEENEDLFWAMRGGGGSTYGVVTSIIIRVHPVVFGTVSTFAFGTSSSNVSADVFWEGVRAFFENFIPYTDAGTYSYWNINNTGDAVTFSMKPFYAPNHTIAQFHALVAPWLTRLDHLGITLDNVVTSHHADFYSAYQATWGKDDGFVGTWTSRPGNRLFPRRNWEDPARFNATFTAVRAASDRGGAFLVGYHQAPRNRAAADNAVSSAWRGAIAFIIAALAVDADASEREMAEVSRRLNGGEVLRAWREVAPSSEGGGSYLNEADVDEPGWQASFYGTRYARLLGIKRKWDPRGVFYATTAVGSDEWEVRGGWRGVTTQDGRLCRV